MTDTHNDLEAALGEIEQRWQETPMPARPNYNGIVYGYGERVGYYEALSECRHIARVARGKD